jgi:hypothetical protein
MQSETRMNHRKRKRRSKSSSRTKYFWWLLVFATVAAAASLILVLERIGVPPRSLAPYVERRSSGHNPLIVSVGEHASTALMVLDRGESQLHSRTPLRIGAQPVATERQTDERTDTHVVLVASKDQALKAIAQARPGDAITFMPGIYRFDGTFIEINRPGTSSERIAVRAVKPGTVTLEFNMEEGFLVTAPYWSIENLTIRGVCADHSSCEHAFHVTDNATYFAALNNTIVDFNSHFKINGSNGHIPDYGLIDGNTLTNTSIRKTGNPVTLIDLVAASHWTIRRNKISDFIKGEGDNISYGAFVKGGGSDNKFEQNMVLCEDRLQGVIGQRVGLSLGGGGTGKEYCRDKRCITEQEGSVIQANLIAYCSDDGIYLNRAATSKVYHNTLIDTGGIVVRFPETSADVEGNLVDGAIRIRNEGLLRATDNLDTSTTRLYLGRHPVRDLFVNPGEMGFAWNGNPPRRSVGSSVPLDLCGTKRPSLATYGAFEDFSACLPESQK